jgi:metal-dependent amidase/aminoacylase/carboxypeptidase family protein
MMVHPADANLRWMQTLAIHQLLVAYEGREAHAAARPWAGENALDAAVLGYMNVGALRQHIRPDERVHGIFTRAGDKPNIVPAHTEAHWYVRAGTSVHLAELEPRVLACLEAGALATGCTMTHRSAALVYDEMISNAAVARPLQRQRGRLGRVTLEPTAERNVIGSTEMGNVSQVVPSIHPMIQAAPEGVSIHTPEFADHARSAMGDRAVIDGAKLLALTALDLWLDPAMQARVAAVHPHPQG